MASDSVPSLVSHLSTVYLDHALRNHSSVWSHEQKQREQKKLKAVAFETIFRYLKDHSSAQFVLSFFCIALPYTW